MKVDGNVVTVKGTKGELTQELDSCVSCTIEDGTITFTRESDAPDHRAKHGLIPCISSQYDRRCIGRV